jgi:hypothetical protein
MTFLETMLLGGLILSLAIIVSLGIILYIQVNHLRNLRMIKENVRRAEAARERRREPWAT